MPFAILSDAELALTRVITLPTFEVAGQTLMKRLAVIIDEGRITKVFYPVFPPNRNASEVLSWIEQSRTTP